MPHFLVDDDFAFNKKARKAGNAAVGLWTRAGANCQKQGTDGIVEQHELSGLGSPAQAKALVDADLWHPHGHGCEGCPQPPKGGWVFHDWMGTQVKTAEQAKREREQARERMRRFRERHRDGDVTRNETGNEQANEHRTSGVGSTTPSPSPSSVVTSSRHLTSVPAGLTDDDLTKIGNATGGDEHHAALVAADVLGRAKKIPGDPLGYVLRSIGNEPDRYKPARRNVRGSGEECPIHAGQFAASCNGCAADRKAAR